MIKVDLDIRTDWISQWKIASDGVSIPPVLETISASSVSPDDVTAGYFVDAINSIDAAFCKGYAMDNLDLLIGLVQIRHAEESCSAD